jgi:hypothetical protein
LIPNDSFCRALAPEQMSAIWVLIVKINYRRKEMNVMNQQEKEQQTVIEDLPIDAARQDEVKGGHAFMKYGDIKGNVSGNQ